MLDNTDIITIETPELSDEDRLRAFIHRNEDAPNKDWATIIEKSENPEYLHWTKIKRKDWIDDIKPETAWAVIKQSRYHRKLPTPICNTENKVFCWTRCAHFDEILHYMTQNLSGHLHGHPHLMDSKEKQNYITRGLIEEAIASSQLEGANTTRKYAKKMIQEGLQPHDKSQRMIMNNYRAMQKIDQDYRHEKLSIELLHDLHKELTKNNTLDQGEPGVFRSDEDEIYINGPDSDGKIAFIPPPMSFVEKQIERLIDFANNELEKYFIHPILKAIMIHFWIGYLHPYGDGNGRLARGLFYWYLMRNDYWAFAFLPLSEAIKKSPKQYGWAYIYSEQDGRDLTYFLDYNLRKILQAQRSFEHYLHKQKTENEAVAQASAKIGDFNPRQIQIARFLVSNKNETTNVTAVTTLFGVSQMTAIRDLNNMLQKGFLRKNKKGRNVFYQPTEKLFALLKTL